MPPHPLPSVTRRAILHGTVGLAAVALMRCSPTTPEIFAADAKGRLPEMRYNAPQKLRAAERPLILPSRSASTPAWLYGETPFPVIRARHGQALDITLENGLAEHSSIHWHGVRVPNAMDGVPYLTQMPVLPGENFSYRFTPPDSGLTIFHPHCNTTVQLGRGLGGVLIVDGDETEPFDDDVLCVLKEWRVTEDGSFLPLTTAEGAGGAGTFGTLRTANGVIAPDLVVPAGSDIRLRIVNLDSTRIGELGLEGADAFVIAVDGNAVTPFALESWRLGPGMRLELSLRTPADGEALTLVDYFAAEPVALARLVARGSSRRSDMFVPRSLKPALLPEPDLNLAKLHTMTLGASAIATDYPALQPIVLPDGRKIDLLDSLCTTARTFWAIDGKTWPEASHRQVPPPFARFTKGESVVIEFFNSTKQPHPMHVHGHMFKVISTSRLMRPAHHADTVLVLPDERVRVAFVADNPGNWMVHCHVIEHQDTGMMAWFEVA